MEHIRQKIDVTNKDIEIAYTVVDTTGWTLPLNQHPSIVEHPELFEISSDVIPDNAQFLKYI
jgi:hypothetical protein